VDQLYVAMAFVKRRALSYSLSSDLAFLLRDENLWARHEISGKEFTFSAYVWTLPSSILTDERIQSGERATTHVRPRVHIGAARDAVSR